jgi:uncharacterized protein with von Willebrand factor type A (vWA) domain
MGKRKKNRRGRHGAPPAQPQQMQLKPEVYPQSPWSVVHIQKRSTEERSYYISDDDYGYGYGYSRYTSGYSWRYGYSSYYGYGSIYSGSYYSGHSYSRSALEGVGYSEEFLLEEYANRAVGLSKMLNDEIILGAREIARAIMRRDKRRQQYVDLFAAIYKINPKLRDKESYLAAVTSESYYRTYFRHELSEQDSQELAWHIARYTALKSMLDSPELPEVVSKLDTALHPFNSTVGTAVLMPVYLRLINSILGRRQEQVNRALQKLQEHQQARRRGDRENAASAAEELEGLLNDLSSSVGPLADMELYAISQQLDALTQFLGAAGAAASEIEKMSRKGKDSGAEQRGHGRGYDTLPAAWRAVEWLAELLKKIAWVNLTLTDRFKMLADLLGRLRVLAGEKTHSKSIVRSTIELTTDLSRLPHIVLSELALPDDVLMWKLASGFIVRKIDRPPQVAEGLGDAIIVLDASGSMEGWPHFMGTLLAYIVAIEVFKRGGKVAVITFSSSAVDRGVCGDLDELVDALSVYCGGGTNPEYGLMTALGYYKNAVKNGELRNPDVLFISDMVFPVSDQTIQLLRKFGEHGARYYNINILTDIEAMEQKPTASNPAFAVDFKKVMETRAKMFGNDEWVEYARLCEKYYVFVIGKYLMANKKPEEVVDAIINGIENMLIDVTDSLRGRSGNDIL